MKRALVIGAGPAGTIAAIRLARLGVDVTLVEQHRFPRDKVCGECLSAMGMDVLERLGLSGDIQDSGAVALTSTVLYGPDGERAELLMPRPMWGFTRSRMDNLLLNRAIAAGVQLVQPARCESIIGSPQPTARIRSLIDNTITEIHADRIFLADGKGMLAGDKPKMTGDFGIKAHFANVAAPSNTIGLYALNGHYLGVAPVEDGLWNLAFSAPLARLKQFDGNFDHLFLHATRENTALVQHFRDASRAGEWLASPLPRFAVSKTWPSGIIPLGNAAAALEPIGGEGMGLAMRSAELATQHIEDAQQLPAEFSSLWNMRRAVCRLAAIALSRPAISGAIVELAGANELAARKIMALMGKV